jgi:hypothetical protein
MLVRNMQHARPSVVIFLGSRGLATRYLESSFSLQLQLQAPHESIRRGSEVFEWTLDRHTLRCDRETWRPATAGETLIFYFMRSVSRSDIDPVQCGRVILSRLLCLRQVSLRPFS